jgi:hypothetical protein
MPGRVTEGESGTPRTHLKYQRKVHSPGCRDSNTTDQRQHHRVPHRTQGLLCQQPRPALFRRTTQISMMKFHSKTTKPLALILVSEPLQPSRALPSNQRSQRNSRTKTFIRARALVKVSRHETLVAEQKQNNNNACLFFVCSFQ